MPRRSSEFSQPRAWLADGEWPSGRFRADAPEAVAYAVYIAVTLAESLAGRNKTQVAADASIERSTLYDMLGGNTWADLVTLAKLERTLDVSLWPAEPPALRRVSD